MDKRITSLHSLILVGMMLCVHLAAQAQFVHPGGVHTLEDLNRMKAKVLAKESPWIEGWNQMIKDSKAQNTYTARPSTSVSGASGVRQQAARDATAAYYNILRWYVTGDESYAKCAVRILNAWSSTVNGVVSGELFQLPIMMLVQSAELVRLYPGWAEADINRYKSMCSNYFYPACRDFIGKCGSWSGWDGPANSCILYIGVFCDDRAKFNEAVEYYKNGAGGGALLNMVCQPSGQVAEMGRDIPHSEIGPGSAAELCQTAYNQGVDLFGYADNRLLAAYEYMSKYNLNHPVDWVPYNDCVNNNFYYMSVLNSYRISESPAYEIIYNHYVVRKGLSAPYTKAMINMKGFRAVGGEYSGYSALTYTLDAAHSPFATIPAPPAPADLKAVPGISRVTLHWTLPGEDVVNGSVVQRSLSKSGPFSTIGTWTYNTSSEYVDSTVTAGITYYYRVALTNTSGTGEYSPVADVTPVSGSPVMPGGWSIADVGKVVTPGSALYFDGNNRSFTVSGSGNSFGGSSDAHTYLYAPVKNNSTLTVRLFDRRLSGSNADRIGLVMRESLNGSSRMASIGVADNGFRYVWFAPRTTAGSSAQWIKGDTHTWTPVWFRLTRSGNTFTGYQSRDGINWFKVGATTISMSGNYYAGLYICSGSSGEGASTTAFIDNVTLSGEGAEAPSVPSGFTATALNSSRVELSWTESKGALSYHIKRAVSADGSYQTIAPACTATGYADRATVADKTYYYSIRSVNFAGESADSAKVTVKTPALALPMVPQGFEVIPGNSTVALNWEDTDEAESYLVKRALSETGPYETVATVSACGYSDEAVKVGTTYYYKVAGMNALGEGAETLSKGITVSSPVKLSGKLIGTPGSNNNNAATMKEAALDGKLNTYFDSDVKDGAWVGLDLGRNNRAIVTRVRYAPRSSNPERMVNGVFEVAAQSDFSDAVQVSTVSSTPPTGSLISRNVLSTQKSRYMRYVAPKDSWGNVAELEFWGHVIRLQNQVITFPSLPVKTTADEDFDPAAVSSSGLEVVYSSSDASVATVVNGKIHIVGEGSCTIYADQAGDEEYGEALQVGKPLTITAPDAVTEVQSKGVSRVSPNPFTDCVRIDLEEGQDEAAVELFDANGKQLISARIYRANPVLNLSTLDSGLYLLKICCKNGVIVEKLIKE